MGKASIYINTHTHTQRTVGRKKKEGNKENKKAELENNVNFHVSLTEIP